MFPCARQIPEIQQHDPTGEGAMYSLIQCDPPAGWQRCLSIILDDYPQVERVLYGRYERMQKQDEPDFGEEDSFDLLALFLKQYVSSVRLRELHLLFRRNFTEWEGKNVRYALVDMGRPLELENRFPTTALIQKIQIQGLLLYSRQTSDRLRQ